VWHREIEPEHKPQRRLAGHFNVDQNFGSGKQWRFYYSRKDLSCYWNLSEQQRGNPAVTLAAGIGQDVIDCATGRTLPPDKLSER
jgi:hypothetical protein